MTVINYLLIIGRWHRAMRGWWWHVVTREQIDRSN
jgi:hypothetical protein